jgi:hypothetical protein
VPKRQHIRRECFPFIHRLENPFKNAFRSRFAKQSKNFLFAVAICACRQGWQILFWYTTTKTGENIPNLYKLSKGHKICVLHTHTNGRKICQHFPIQGPPKYSQIGIFWTKINHLATLLPNSSFISFAAKLYVLNCSAHHFWLRQFASVHSCYALCLKCIFITNSHLKTFTCFKL